MKKWLVALPLVFSLYACGGNEEQDEMQGDDREVEQHTQDSADHPIYVASSAEWEMDERLQEPTEHTKCEMCDMEVYMKDHELGIFSAQAVKPDESIAFYDDIGCLLNAELAQQQPNEKFVRDYVTSNWIKVDEATVVKTDLKSPMNWGYIFFAYEEDANTYVEDHPIANIEELDVIRQAAKERYEKKMMKNMEGK